MSLFPFHTKVSVLCQAIRLDNVHQRAVGTAKQRWSMNELAVLQKLTQQKREKGMSFKDVCVVVCERVREEKRKV